MARPRPSLEDQLARLAELRAQAPGPESRAEVARYLASKINLLAAKAARMAGEWEAQEMIPALAAAFERFLTHGAATDKRCAAKIEILKALCRLEYPEPSLFRRGLGYIQMEAAWGGPADTAAEVRALSAMGLAQTRDPDALEEILPLLLDPQRDARIGAVRALAASGLPGGELLVRFKALSGDEPEVLGECFAALLRTAPAKTVAFVAGFLQHREAAIAEAAALALGDSRLESAFPVLREAAQRPGNRPLRQTLLLAMALLRREVALDYLLQRVAQGDAQTSADAAAALAMYRQDSVLQAKLERALASRARAPIDTCPP
jgi:HEAT repeat protein